MVSIKEIRLVFLEEVVHELAREEKGSSRNSRGLLLPQPVLICQVLL